MSTTKEKPKAKTSRKSANQSQVASVPDDPLAVNVRRLRIKLGLTQQELAERIGWDQPRIAQIEFGGQDRRWSTIRRLAEALNVRPETLTKALKPRNKNSKGAGAADGNEADG